MRPERIGRHSLSKKRPPHEMTALEAQLREAARREQYERCKRGLLDLMNFHSDGIVIDLEWQEGDAPWVLVTLWFLGEELDRTDEFAIWKATGNVYRVHQGAVEDEPFLLTTPFDRT